MEARAEKARWILPFPQWGCPGSVGTARERGKPASAAAVWRGDLRRLDPQSCLRPLQETQPCYPAAFSLCAWRPTLRLLNKNPHLSHHQVQSRTLVSSPGPQDAPLALGSWKGHLAPPWPCPADPARSAALFFFFFFFAPFFDFSLETFQEPEFQGSAGQRAFVRHQAGEGRAREDPCLRGAGDVCVCGGARN